MRHIQVTHCLDSTVARVAEAVDALVVVERWRRCGCWLAGCREQLALERAHELLLLLVVSLPF